MFERLRQKLFGGPSRARPDTTLVDAAQRVDVVEVRRLLDGGANPNVCDVFAYTPLMRAVSGSTRPAERREVIDLLLGAGADVDAVEQAGQTALIHAAHSDAVESVKRLLAAGASLRVRASSGCDALQIAFEHANLELARVLAEAELADHAPGATPRALVCASFLGDVARVRHELERGAPPSSSPSSGEELGAIHAAVCGGDVAIVLLLLDSGASIDALDLEGVTPLIQAARMGHADVVKVLVERGADLAANAGGVR